MPTQPLIEQLINAQLDFLEQTFFQPNHIESEFVGFYHWLSTQSLNQIWSLEQVNALIQNQILSTSSSEFFIQQISEHIRFALIHPLNDHTTIEQVIPVSTIDQIAQYVASKSEHRKKLIHQIVQNTAFSTLITQLIQQAIQDYLDHSVSKRVPAGVGHFMKMGKSVLETVTDTNLQDTIGHYLQKNIQKITQMSERVINQHFDEDKLYHLQANIWHKIKVKPLSVLRQYIEVQDLEQTVALGREIWDTLRQTEYLQQQVHDGLSAWYARNQDRSFQAILRDINIDENLIKKELSALIIPVLQRLIVSGYLRQRAREYLEQFYYSEQVMALIKSQGT